MSKTALIPPTNVTSLRLAEGNLERLFRLVKKPLWTQRSEALLDRHRWLPQQPPFHIRRHQLELWIALAIGHHRRTGRYLSGLQNEQNYEVATFAHSLVRLLDYLPDAAHPAVAGKLRQSLSGDNCLRPLRLELDTMAHVVGSGLEVVPVDYLADDPATNDYKVIFEGQSIAVECKHVDAGTGMTVPKLIAYQLFNKLLGTSRRRRIKLTGYATCITVDGRVEDIGYDRLVGAVCSSHLASARPHTSHDGFDVSIVPMEHNLVAAIRSNMETTGDPDEAVWASVRSKLGLLNSASILAFDVGEGPTVVGVSSRRENRVVQTVFDRLKDDARRQFHAEDTGVLVVELSELRHDDAKFFVQRSDSDLLRAAVLDLFRKRPSVAAVLLLPGMEGTTRQVGMGLGGSRPSLTFVNEQHAGRNSSALGRFIGQLRGDPRL